jgi:hypothetical protein
LLKKQAEIILSKTEQLDIYKEKMKKNLSNKEKIQIEAKAKEARKEKNKILDD